MVVTVKSSSMSAVRGFAAERRSRVRELLRGCMGAPIVPATGRSDAAAFAPVAAVLWSSDLVGELLGHLDAASAAALAGACRATRAAVVCAGGWVEAVHAAARMAATPPAAAGAPSGAPAPLGDVVAHLASTEWRRRTVPSTVVSGLASRTRRGLPESVSTASEKDREAGCVLVCNQAEAALSLVVDRGWRGALVERRIVACGSELGARVSRGLARLGLYPGEPDDMFSEQKSRQQGTVVACAVLHEDADVRVCALLRTFNTKDASDDDDDGTIVGVGGQGGGTQLPAGHIARASMLMGALELATARRGDPLNQHARPGVALRATLNVAAGMRDATWLLIPSRSTLWVVTRAAQGGADCLFVEGVVFSPAGCREYRSFGLSASMYVAQVLLKSALVPVEG